MIPPETGSEPARFLGQSVINVRGMHLKSPAFFLYAEDTFAKAACDRDPFTRCSSREGREKVSYISDVTCSLLCERDERARRLRRYASRFVTLSAMRITSGRVDCQNERDAATDSNHCNRPVYHLAAEKALASHSHSLRRWRYTFGEHHGRESRCYFCQRNSSTRHQTVCVRRDILDSGLVHYSIHGLHKIPAHQQ